MKATDHVGITFAGLVLGRGILNGVVNITLGAFEFNPGDDGKKVESSPVIVSRLRMDVPCAKALYDALGELIHDATKIAAKAEGGVVAAHLNGAEPALGEKTN